MVACSSYTDFCELLQDIGDSFQDVASSCMGGVRVARYVYVLLPATGATWHLLPQVDFEMVHAMRCMDSLNSKGKYQLMLSSAEGCCNKSESPTYLNTELPDFRPPAR